MPRLTCPHLVKAIDELEADQGVQKYNAILSIDEELKENFKETMKEWNNILKSVLTEEDIARFRKDFGDDYLNLFLNLGFIGMTMNKFDDVKCLHAHVADYLLRGKNKIGELVMAQLEQSNINTSGCDGIILKQYLNFLITIDSIMF